MFYNLNVDFRPYILGTDPSKETLIGFIEKLLRYYCQT